MAAWAELTEHMAAKGIVPSELDRMEMWQIAAVLGMKELPAPASLSPDDLREARRKYARGEGPRPETGAVSAEQVHKLGG